MVLRISQWHMCCYSCIRKFTDAIVLVLLWGVDREILCPMETASKRWDVQVELHFQNNVDKLHSSSLRCPKWGNATSATIATDLFRTTFTTGKNI